VASGFAEDAGYCIAASATRDGRNLIAVVLGGARDTEGCADAIAMLDYGFAGFAKVDLFDREACTVSVPVNGGAVKTVDLVPSAASSVMLSMQAAGGDGIRYEYDLPESLDAPLTSGDAVGKVRAYAGGDEPVAETDMVLADSVEGKSSGILGKPNISLSASSAIKLAALAVVILIIVFIAVLIRHGLGRSTYGRSMRFNSASRGSRSTRQIKRVKRIK
jgi:D-alanyl-D-alanine carboxypeptidase